MGDTNIGSDGLPKSSYKIDEALLASFIVQNPQFAFLASTLSQSDQELAVSPLLAGNPRLPPADPAALALYMQNKIATITLAVLEAWGKALEEAAELVKKEINSSAYLVRQEIKHEIALPTKETAAVSSPGVTTHKAEVDLVERYVWLNSLAGLVSALIHMEQSTGVPQGGVTPISSIDKGINPLDPTFSAATASILAPQFLMLAIADSTLFRGGAIVGPVSASAPASASAIDGLHAESKVFQGTWAAISNQSNESSSLIAGWVSSLWGIGLIYRLSADTIKVPGVERGDKSADINFAKTYAETILGVIASGQFTTTIEAALANATGKTTTSPGPDTNALVTKAKLALLSVALGLLLKLEEGKTSEPVFSGYLKGEVDLTKNDPHNTASIKRALLDEIKQMLTTLEPEDRTQVVQNLLEYMSKDPAIEEMLDQQKVFKNVLANKSFENELIDKRPLDV